MGTGQRVRSTALLVCFGLVPLVGCTSTLTPIPSSPTASAPSPSVARAPASLVIHGDRLEAVDKRGDVLSVGLFSDGAAAVSRYLERLLGPPMTSSASEGVCGPTREQSEWGKALAVFEAGEPSEPQAHISFTAARFGPLALSAPGGATVGEPTSRLISSVPEAETYSSSVSNGTWVWYDLTPLAGAGRSGVEVVADLSTKRIEFLDAPAVYFPNPDDSTLQGDC